MHPKSWLRIPGTSLAVALSCVAGVACDAQFSPEYLGDPLLTVSGSVEISEDRTEGRLIPALAFTNQGDGQVDIVEVGVHGEFPSDFRLDVYERPPREAFFEASHQRGEPRLALGYITAVSSDHPDKIRFATNQNVMASAGCLDPECTKTCESEGVECRVLTNEWCQSDGTTCYQEVMFCPTLEAWAPDCRIESKGDPAIKDEPFRHFAGFSSNYVVAYLEARAPAGSWTAALLGSPDGVAAGYGLYAYREFDQGEQQAAAECSERVPGLAARKYNAAHGTDYASIGIDACQTCGPGCAEQPVLPEFCSGTNEQLDAWQAEFDRYTEQSKLELGCAAGDFVLTRVSAPERESVSVRISPDAKPF
ncbi:MAG TPA: hypothetical protein VJV78_25045 [Polyangiales bacterium]|nr:hypothetical protein [Polyangiales bacterium]